MVQNKNERQAHDNKTISIHGNKVVGNGFELSSTGSSIHVPHISFYSDSEGTRMYSDVSIHNIKTIKTKNDVVNGKKVRKFELELASGEWVTVEFFMAKGV